MKRFWRSAEAGEAEGGWTIRLDGRAIQTPCRVPLAVPVQALAEAIAGEWARVEEKVDPASMPLTGLANAAIDRVAPDRESFAAGLARYGESDLLCYRAEGPKALADRQAAKWDALLSWARRRYDVEFAVTAGIIHKQQPKATVERLAHEVARLDAFRLAGLSPLVTAGGSLIAALAVLDGTASAEEAWSAVTVDEAWQSEQWGVDEEAQAALDARKAEYIAGSKFLKLLD